VRSKSKGGLVLVVLSFILIPVGYGHAGKKGGKESKLSAWTNIRLRYEYQDDFNGKFYGDEPKAGKSNDGFLLGRFRFGFHYYPNEIIHLSVGTQHAEAWDLALKESDYYNSNFDRFHNPYEDDWEPSVSKREGRLSLTVTEESTVPVNGETQAGGNGMRSCSITHLREVSWIHTMGGRRSMTPAT